MTEKEFSNIHQEVWSLLPWYINQTLSPDEDHRVEQHLSSCLVCRTELNQQKLVQQAVIASASEDNLAERSLNNLHQRIQQDSKHSKQGHQQVSQQPLASLSNWINGVWRTLRESHLGIQTALVAQTAVIMVAVMVAVGEKPALSDTNEYRTLTSEAAPLAAAGVTFKVIFAERLTLVELQSLLESEGLSISSGPSPAGAYELSMPASASTFSKEDDQGVDQLLATLKNHPAIRFVTINRPQ